MVAWQPPAPAAELRGLTRRMEVRGAVCAGLQGGKSVGLRMSCFAPDTHAPVMCFELESPLRNTSCGCPGVEVSCLHTGGWKQVMREVWEPSPGKSLLGLGAGSKCSIFH